MSPAWTRKPPSPVLERRRATPPTSVETTGTPGRERLDQRHRRALVRRRERDRVARGDRAAPTSSRKPRKWQRSAIPSSRGQLLERRRAAGRRRRAAGRHRAAAPAARANASSRSSTRLISVIRPSQPTTNASVGDAERRAGPRARARRAAVRAVEVEPEPDDGDPLRPARRRARTRSSRTSGLTAISASRRPRRAAARPAGTPPSAPAPK